MQENQKKTSNILFAIIAILLLLLVIETGILVSKSSHPAAPIENKKNAEVTKNNAPAQIPAAQPAQPTIAVAYDPFAPSPYLRKPRSPRTQTDPISSYSDMNDPFYAMGKIQERMNRLFDTAMLNAQLSEPNLMNNPKNNMPAANLEPAADIQDDGKNYIVKSDMPGLEKDKINIDIEGNNLSITGTREKVTEQKDDATGFVSQERSYGSFSKVLTLPGPVDETKVFADYKNGVLTIRLPKVEVKKNQQKVSVQ